MNIVLWVLQAVLAAVFLGAGLPKIAKPKEELVASMGEWVSSFPAPGVKLLGLVEVLGAVGLIVPPLTGIAPALSPVAAVGIIVIMLGAIVAHARESAGSKIAMNVVLGVLAAVVAWGRFGPYAF
ncbi:DoxX family protein [Streptomyces sp. MN03-5084-2B]|nr:DoxX family protein [Streptomyces sp. MN03-5084-2B]